MIEIRQAVHSDLDDLQSLVCGFREVLGRRLPDDDTLRESLEELLMSSDSEFFIAFGDTSMMVGYIQQRYRFSSVAKRIGSYLRRPLRISRQS